MAVTGIGVERDVAEDADLGNFILDRTYRAANQIVRIERFRAGVVAPAGLGIGK
jgi:hypothetical protein